MHLKQKLSYAYRILAKLKMDDHTYTHLSARPQNADYFYIYPFGLRFEEVREDTLLKVSLEGDVIEGKEWQYNKTGYIIHGSIYKDRPDLSAVFHLHTPSTIAVSSMQDGLLPISQWALHFYEKIAHHEYNSLALDDTHGNALVNDLGSKNILFLRNHGFITCGKNIHEAMFYCYHLEQACKTQILAQSTGTKLIFPNKNICKKANKDLLNFEQDLGARDWEAWVRWVDMQ